MSINNYFKGLIASLKKGQTVQIRPRGNSMKGKIEDGNLVTLEPCSKKLNIGDIVLVHVNNHDYIHLIKQINNEKYLIGNNQGRLNGWVGINNIYGVVTKIEK